MNYRFIQIKPEPMSAGTKGNTNKTLLKTFTSFKFTFTISELKSVFFSMACGRLDESITAVSFHIQLVELRFDFEETRVSECWISERRTNSVLMSFILFLSSFNGVGWL